MRQLQPPHRSLDDRLTGRSKLLGAGSQEERPFLCGVRVERRLERVQGGAPVALNRRAHVPPPEGGHVLKPPDDRVSADGAKQKQIQGEGGGSDITVTEAES